MRERLPSRRGAATITVEWRGRPMFLLVSRRLGRPLEIFARAGKPDSDLDMTADDIAVLISLALQHGVELDAIRHSLGRLPDGSPASIAGAVVNAAIEIEKTP